VRKIKIALDNAERDRTLAHRAVARADIVEQRLDGVAADIRELRSDVAAIDVKLVALPKIEDDVAAIREKLR
jgi:hypothetical protein